ncbi:HAD family phosphatase [Candidatus Saccharibacteria bacterium]|nr:HAD family phosphatase [Candidatus Saccharibacteria bacterium]
MIKAIIFDCFGVLSTEGFRVFCDQYFKNSPDKRAAAQTAMDQLSLGNMQYESFENALAELAGVSKKIVSSYLEGNKPNVSLFEFIREKLKPRYKVGMLSNTGADWLDQLFTPEQIALLDDVVQSYKLGIAKPDPRIYEAAARNLGVQPSECVMIDDIARYCQSARDIGMQAIQYKDFEQMKIELEALL